MSDAYRHIKNTKDKKSAGSSNEVSGSDSASKKYKMSFKPADAVILHPSFLCPALKKTGDDLTIFLLGDWRFNTTYLYAEGKEDKRAGPALSGAINRFLKIVEWGSNDKTCHAPQPLFTSNDEAKANIEVYYLWEVSELDDGVLLDKDGKPFAQAHPDVLKLYQRNRLYWGFQIVIKNLPMDNPGLYDISWMNYELPKTEDENGYFYELQDQYINDFNTSYRTQYHPLQCDVSADDRPVFKEESTELQSYHPLYISGKLCLDIGHLSDVHVSARQHLFTQSKAKLIDGKEGDGHRSDEIGGMVNTSYATLKNLMGKMGSDVDLLVFTGDLIDYNRNYNPDNSADNPEELKKSSGIWQALNLDNLSDKQRYPIGIDNLVIYELFRWYYDTHKKPILLVSGNHEAYTLPYGISPRMMVGRSFNATYNFFHRISVDEAIEKSKKLAKKDAEKAEKAIKDGKHPDVYDSRANEGIPADHNLTISEAILMYGPDYARIVMSASYNWGNEKNFRAENLKWFFHLFTPLTSYYLTYGDQCFIGLGWGNDERFVGHIPKAQGEWKAGGFLPRSVEGVTEQQLQILNQALEDSKAQNVLCSHFTYINYNTNIPISEKGQVSGTDGYGRYDYGTFENNRGTVYPLIKDKIQYALSGHSHRSGLYQITKDESFVLQTEYGPVESVGYEVQGQAAKDNKFQPKGGTRFMVAASGGPIPVQNHDNELFNWGLDVPSGNYIKFSGSSEAELGIKTAESKPRLAVALDYADIFLAEEDKDTAFKKGVFGHFESSEEEEPFIIKFSESVKLNAEDIIDEVKLVIYQKGGHKIEIQGSAQNFDRSKHNFELKINTKAFDKTLDLAADKSLMGFIDITLKSAGASRHVYNTNKHWVYPIEVVFRKKREIERFHQEKIREISYTSDSYTANQKLQAMANEIEKMNNTIKGYIIQRHSLFGEIPNFDFYIKKFNDEYA